MKSAQEALLAQRSAHQRRLDELVIQRATIGIATPPEINTEIEDISAEISKIDSSLEALERFKSLRAASDINPYLDRRDSEYQQHIMVATVMAMVAEFATLTKNVENRFAKQDKLLIVFGLTMGLFMIAIMFIVGFRFT
jgi:hypothetical protein